MKRVVPGTTWWAGLVLVTACGSLGAGPVEFEGQIRTRFEYQDDYDYNSTVADSRDQLLLRTTLGAKWKKDERVSAFLQIRDSRIAGGNPLAPPLAAAPPAAVPLRQRELHMHQGYVDYRPGGDSDWVLRLGRQEVNFGEERLVGALDWANVARAFDGFRATRKKDDRQLDAFVLSLADTNGTGRDDQELSGFHFNRKVGAKGSLDAYALHYRDDVTLSAASQTGVLGHQSFWTFGFRSLGPLFQAEEWDYRLEAAFQKGDFSIDDLDAMAMALVFGRNFPSARKGRFEFEFDWSPGDEARPGERGTFQNLFPTNHKFYGIGDHMAWMNMRAFRLGYKWSPAKDRWVLLDLWRFALDDLRDRWYRVNGAARAANPGATSKDLGTEIDVRYNWKDGSVGFEVGLAAFLADDYSKTFPGGRGDDSLFGYLSATFNF